MEAYQVVGLAVMLGMGFVVHSTMSLNRVRKQMGVPKQMLNFRDLEVLRHPDRFDPLEVRMVRTTWVACAVVFALALTLMGVLPQEMVEQLKSAGPPG